VSGKRRAAGPAVTKRSSNGGGKRPWLRRTLKLGGISGLVLVVLAVTGFAILYKAIDVPDPNADFQTETSFVYYNDGKTELGTFATQNRDSIPLAEMPASVKAAVVAAEDRSFWTNQGIDPKGILRAAFSNAQGGATQGASTITQQYVKILYLTQERSYTRKAKEAVISLKLAREAQSKEQILEGYLNTIYFGRGAYGVQAAADAFFNKPAADLTVGESAVLASVINNPTRFDPANGRDNRAALLGRYQYVLDGMVEMGELDAARADRIEGRLPKLPEQRGQSVYAGQRGHMLELIRRELLRTGEFTEEEINGGGLQITTTLTKKAMDAAREGVQEVRPQGKKGLHVAVASVEPGTGALRGFYGGHDYLRSQINWAVTGGQPGSTFKPFALAAGIDAGFSLKDTFEGNSPYVFPNGDEVKNLGEDGGVDYGSSVDLVKATEDSINTAYIDLTASIPDGPEKVLETASKMGIPKWDKKQNSRDHLRNSPGLEPNSGIALGSATVSPINMANGFATIADRGDAAEVFVIKKVVDRTGEVRYRHRVKTEQALDRDIADDVSYALQQVVSSGSGTAAQALGRPAAGKTGTATAGEEGYVSSSWFVGYTPQMSTAVMYVRGDGNDSLEGFLDPFFGGTYPAQTWTAVMRRLMEGREVGDFPPPAFVDGDAPAEGHAPTPPPPPPEPEPTRTPKPKPTTSEPEPEPTTSAPPSPSPSKTPICLVNPDHPQCQPDEPEPTEPTDEPTDEPGGGGQGGGLGGGGTNGAAREEDARL
jgi:membrane peptidoglycan carboxypeptidase